MNQDRAPTWTLLLGALLAVMGIGFSIGIAFQPTILFPTVTGGDPMLGSWVVRNLATAIILGFGVLSRRAGYLLLGLLARAVTELGDGILALQALNVGALGFPLIMLAFEIPALIALLRRTEVVAASS